MKTLFAIVLLVLGGCLTIFVDMLFLKDGKFEKSTVIDRVYVSSTTSVGNTIDHKGRVGIVVNSTPEKWLAVLRVDDTGEVQSASCTKDSWASLKEGQPAILISRVGFMTGITWEHIAKP